MTVQSVAFPYERRPSLPFGLIQRPVARVEWHSAIFKRWIAYTMVVDTGADYCVLPASAALDLGVTLQRCEPSTASGVGGTQPIFLHHATRMRIGRWDLLVPVGFVNREDLPPLLGRHRCLDVFDLRFRHFITTLSATASDSG